MLMAALAAYVGFCAVLMQHDLVRGTESAFWQFIGVWSVGLLALLFVRQRNPRITLARVAWLNVGVVILALLVPHTLRFLMLVPAMFGVMYAGLLLRRRQVWFASSATFSVYLVLDVILVGYGEVDVRFEAASLAGFAAMLIGVNFISDEVYSLRLAFTRRRRMLDKALTRLEKLVVRDDLTGAYNRRYINDVLTRQKALADRGQIDFTVCFCDLDHFKQVNDGYGHGCGDDMLIRFAELAEETLRSVDFVARWGGDEFLLVLIGTDTLVAEQVTNRLREHTHEIRMEEGGAFDGISVSIGVAQFCRGERVEQLLARADLALYEAKMLGRNRVVVSGRSSGIRSAPAA
jgi:diguanylate cyclase (GGDEF)-like protein|tara:strand:+ start:2117 stop:3160 length:1044 start_codon:yes stop_codon:yes gene_type:complete